MKAIDLKKQFVIVMGGAGSGKNYFIRSNPEYFTFKLIDVDAIKGEMGLSAAIKAIKPMLIDSFEAGRNVVHPTTGSHLIGQKNKIKLAHQYGYHVTLILVATPLERAIAQVRRRVQSGGHDVEIAYIESSNKRARDNFNLLKLDADSSRIVTH